jgi:hypothetical protein
VDFQLKEPKINTLDERKKELAMTQLIGVVTRKHVFHVSDRLLSQRTSNGIQTFDSNSNKAVIFCATDAHVVVSYTGRAYLNNIPTDTFIAENLIGLKLGRGAFIGIGRPVSWTDIGRSVERLRQNLSVAFQALSAVDRQGYFRVSIMGWRQLRTRSKRVTPIIWELVRITGTEHEFQLANNERWWRWDHGFNYQAIPNMPDPTLFKDMGKELGEHGSKSPDEIRRILVESLHKCSKASPTTIGRACLLITLTPTARTHHARLRFIADSQRPHDVPPDNIGYTPWIIAPPFVYAPALVRSSSDSGGWTQDGGGFSWVIDGLGAEHGSKGNSQSSQPRPHDPQKS